MKTIKKLLFIIGIALLLFIALGCSTEEDDRQPSECECTRYDYELTFQILNSQTFWFEELIDSYPVVCQEERERVFYYEQDGVRKFYNIECNGE